MAMWRMRVACWIPKATNTHSQYVILIALPLQQWLHQRASVLRCTFIACIVYIKRKFHQKFPRNEDSSCRPTDELTYQFDIKHTKITSYLIGNSYCLCYEDKPVNRV